MNDLFSERIFWILIGAIILAIFTLSTQKNVRKSFTKTIVHIPEKLSFKGRLLSEINRVRKKHGLLQLGRTSFLDRVAAKHSRYQARKRQCNHDYFASRYEIIKSKTHSGYIGENCYMFSAKRYTRRVAVALVKGWMKSKGHRENILNGRYRKTGIGIVVKSGYVYATQIFSD